MKGRVDLNSCVQMSPLGRDLSPSPRGWVPVCISHTQNNIMKPYLRWTLTSGRQRFGLRAARSGALPSLHSRKIGRSNWAQFAARIQHILAGSRKREQQFQRVSQLSRLLPRLFRLAIIISLRGLKPGCRSWSRTNADHRFDREHQ